MCCWYVLQAQCCTVYMYSVLVLMRHWDENAITSSRLPNSGLSHVAAMIRRKIPNSSPSLVCDIMYQIGPLTDSTEGQLHRNAYSAASWMRRDTVTSAPTRIKWNVQAECDSSKTRLEIMRALFGRRWKSGGGEQKEITLAPPMGTQGDPQVHFLFLPTLQGSYFEFNPAATSFSSSSSASSHVTC